MNDIKLPPHIEINDVQDISDWIDAHYEPLTDFIRDNGLGTPPTKGQVGTLELYKLSQYREGLQKEIHEANELHPVVLAERELPDD
jgi:hypothetical protein